MESRIGLRQFLPRLRSKKTPSIPGPIKALSWLRTHESVTGGIVAHSGEVTGDPVVTGALLPTLVRFGEQEQAMRCAAWLLRIQRPDGSYARPGRDLSIFETSQVLHGMLAIPDLMPGLVDSARRAAEYACERIFGQICGRSEVPPYSDSDRVQLATLRYLHEAVSILKKVKQQHVVEYCLQHMLRNSPSQRGSSTDSLADDLDALLDLGKAGLARKRLDEIAETQHRSGWIPAKPNGLWLSSAGLAHLSVCWHKVGRSRPANRALSWLEKHQLSSGGFVRAYGWTAPRYSNFETSRTIKWYLDSHYWRMRSLMEREVYLSDICLSDGRVQALAALITPGDRVLEVGCELGRFLKAISRIYSDVHCTGVDIAPALLAAIPGDIETCEGALERVPFPDDSFDVVFSVEALEHSANVEAAIKELSRVTRPGGCVAIIGKERRKWDPFGMGRYCDRVSCQAIAHDGETPERLMMWVGRKQEARPNVLRQRAS